MYEYGVPGGALKLNSTNYPDHGHHGDPPLSGEKIPIVEPGIEIYLNIFLTLQYNTAQSRIQCAN
jgi:hypothetical protein